jgi:glycosyltransferase involved in cell wall biosynthesis
MLGIEAGARVLVFAAHGGLANPYKDGTLLLEAAQRVADRQGPVELVVVGGERRSAATHGALTLREVPYVPGTGRLADVYRAADLYVHAAREETFCNTAAEALACGVPVVAAAGGGLPEVVRHEVTGLVSEPGAIDPFARGIERLLADGDERRRMGTAASADARARFDEDRMVDTYLDVCSRALERAGATAAG